MECNDCGWTGNIRQCKIGQIYPLNRQRFRMCPNCNNILLEQTLPPLVFKPHWPGKREGEVGNEQYNNYFDALEHSYKRTVNTIGQVLYGEDFINDD